MDGWQVRWWIAAMAIVCAATAEAQPAPPSAARGELLYKTHCVSCHTTQVHWRDRKLAADWKGLQAQVRRWQRNTGLKWSEQEIADVTRYLNGEFYHFAPPARQAQGPASYLTTNVTLLRRSRSTAEVAAAAKATARSLPIDTAD